MPKNARASTSRAERTNYDETQVAAWCFTINNPNARDWQSIRELWKFDAICWQLERGESGTLHIQGCVLFSRSIRGKTVSKMLGGRSSNSPARFLASAVVYAQREDKREPGTDPFMYGTFPSGQGARTDWDQLHLLVRNNAQRSLLYDNHFGLLCRSPNGISRAISHYAPNRAWKSEVHVYWGKTGTGKTYRASTENPGACWISPPQPGQPYWFDNYSGEECAIFDEFYGHMALPFFLVLIDAYPLKVPTKGNFVGWVPKKIVFTSNRDPQFWYPNADFATIKRRIFLNDHMENLYVAK